MAKRMWRMRIFSGKAKNPLLFFSNVHLFFPRNDDLVLKMLKKNFICGLNIWFADFFPYLRITMISN